MGLIRNDMGAFVGGWVNYWLSVEEELSPAEKGLSLKTFPNPFKYIVYCVLSAGAAIPCRSSGI
jgi:hypothetical protein